MSFPPPLDLLYHPQSVPFYLAALAYALYLLLKRTVKRLASGSHIAASTAARMIGALRVVFVSLVALFFLQSTGVVGEVWAIISATIAALAVAFVATWSILSNVTAAGIILGFRPFRVGDSIEVFEGDKLLVSGIVLDLNLMFTTIKEGNAVSRVPNNIFVQRVVRVSRAGQAPNPREDASTPFF